jgi:hypothetical protein
VWMQVHRWKDMLLSTAGVHRHHLVTNPLDMANLTTWYKAPTGPYLAEVGQAADDKCW